MRTRSSGTPSPHRLSEPHAHDVEFIASATLSVETGGEGFVEITRDAGEFLARAGAGDGVLLCYVRHTSASLAIQENADPDVQVDLVTALRKLAPDNAGWVHDTEGPDDMPAHVKAMLTGVSLHIEDGEGLAAILLILWGCGWRWRCVYFHRGRRTMVES